MLFSAVTSAGEALIGNDKFT